MQHKSNAKSQCVKKSNASKYRIHKEFKIYCSDLMFKEYNNYKMSQNYNISKRPITEYNPNMCYINDV